MGRVRTAKSRFSRFIGMVCLTSGLAWHQGGALVPLPRPNEGAVANGIYTNRYFNLSYRLPPQWTEGLAGPPPSESGYYVLGTLVPVAELTGTILIAAQDTFFADKALSDPAAMAMEIGRATSEIEGMTVDRPPSMVSMGGRTFGRIDVSGFGLFRATLITEIRCHLVSFNLTAGNREGLAGLVASLNDLADAGERSAAGPDPICLSNGAPPEHALAKVDPAPIAPTFVPIPVRITIGADGSVKHVNVIRATAPQRESIETALGQWRFKPPQLDSLAVEIETGMVIEFTPDGGVIYSGGERRRAGRAG